MIIIILMMLFDTLPPINTISPLFEFNQLCHCLSSNLDDLEVNYNHITGYEFSLNVNIWDDVLITCKNPEQSFSDFHFTSQVRGKNLTSLSFKHCLLSEQNSLKELVRKLGIEGSNAFSYQSFTKTPLHLKKEHLHGISKVRELNLSYNSLTNISSDILLDFPELVLLDLSYNNLTLASDIFDASPNLKHLMLNKNDISAINPRLFESLNNLETLNLEENNLEIFEDGIFSKLVSLKSLSLAGNNLIQLSMSTFRQLLKLEKIDISYNNILSIPLNLFLENKALKEILFHDNKANIYYFPNHLLSNLKDLEYVYLYNNGFSKLPENIFWGSEAIKILDLSLNLLTTLPYGIFKNLTNLQTLSIKDNKIEYLPIKIFEDLKKLRKLDLSRNLMDFIPNGLFEGLISLTELNVEDNQLKYIEQEALFPLKNLSIAEFSNNQLKLANISTKWSPFLKNTMLKELHLSNNKIEEFFDDWSISLTNLQELNLRLNNITKVSASNFYFPSNQIVVDLRYNKISNIFLKGVEESATYQTEKRHVKVLLDDNPILCDCNLYDLVRYFQNEMPIIVYNFLQIMAKNLPCIQNDGTEGPNIKELLPTAFTCPEDEYFQIEKNCQRGCTCSVRPQDKTRIIDCSYQDKFEFSLDQRRMNDVEGYPITLNLTGNYLRKMPSISNLTQLNITGLLLSNNNINRLELRSIPKTLYVLELHNNNIHNISSLTLNILKSSSLKEFTLSGNPLMCTCSSAELIIFVQLKRSTFKDLENLKCYNLDLYMHELTTEKLCLLAP